MTGDKRIEGPHPARSKTMIISIARPKRAKILENEKAYTVNTGYRTSRELWKMTRVTNRLESIVWELWLDIVVRVGRRTTGQLSLYNVGDTARGPIAVNGADSIKPSWLPCNTFALHSHIRGQIEQFCCTNSGRSLRYRSTELAPRE